MLWQLTRWGVVFSLLAETALGQPSTRAERASDKTPPGSAATHAIEWEHLPLYEAIKRLKSVSDMDVFMDRRVDPSQTINLSLSNASAEEIIENIAEKCSLGCARWERVTYLGPPQVAARVKTLAAMRRKDAAALPTTDRQSLLERRRIVWPRLSEPRDLVARLMEEHGWKIEHGERIPHDLWPAGELPPLTLADQLAILLAGFDLSYRIVPERRAIEIISIDWDQISPDATRTATVKRLKHPTSGDKQVFTLRVENQPVGKVLEQLGRRLGWKLTVDEVAIRAAGRSLDAQISFAVENANEDQLLDALLAPARLKAERDGSSVRIKPR